MRIQMAHLAEALARTDAYGCAGVGPDPEGSRDPKVFEKRLIPEALAGAPDNAGELGFP